MEKLFMDNVWTDIKVLQQDLVFNMVQLSLGLQYLGLVVVSFVFCFCLFCFVFVFRNFTNKWKNQIDINECLSNNGGCNVNALCANTEGSFSCTCKTGYSGNGFICEGILPILNETKKKKKKKI